MGDDARRTSDPPVSVDEADCFDQTDIASSYPIPPHWVGRTVYGGAGGELCFYTWKYWERVSGAGFGINPNWITNVAGTTNTFGVEVLAGEVNGCGVFGDYSYMSGEELTPGWNISRIWRYKKQRYGLVGEVCPHCEHKIFPPREGAPCPNCGGEVKELFSMLINDKNPDEVKTAAAIIVATTE
ncbi:MAG: hypothetical protein Fur0011_1860 [Candidatus Microgenomates bacterium]